MKPVISKSVKDKVWPELEHIENILNQFPTDVGVEVAILKAIDKIKEHLNEAIVKAKGE